MACMQWSQPEQDGQANRTWSNIVGNPIKQNYVKENEVPNDSHLSVGYIPLKDKEELLYKNLQDSKQLKRKLPCTDKTPTNNCAESLYCTPWKATNYVQDPIGLHHEMNDFLQYIKPKQEEDDVRKDVVKRVEAVIKQLWPKARVELYGSCQTGLYLPTSDIDLVVHGKWECLPLRTLENELIEQGIADVNSIRVLDKASVPIIKVTDTKTMVKIDISFNMNNGVQSAELIKSYMEQYPPLACLAFVIKQLLVNRDLNEVFIGGLSSYTVVLMIVSFFQRHTDNFQSSHHTVNWGVLLIEFFELYGKKFNYDNVGIRVVGNGSYFNKEEVLGKSLANETHLCIEDPLTKGNYIGKGSFRINDVKRLFEWAYHELTKGVLNKIPGNENSSILGRLALMRRDTIQQRERLLRLPCAPAMPCAPTNNRSYASVATGNTTQSRICRPVIECNSEKNSTTRPSKSRENIDTVYSVDSSSESSSPRTRETPNTTARNKDNVTMKKYNSEVPKNCRIQSSRHSERESVGRERSQDKSNNRKHNQERTHNVESKKSQHTKTPIVISDDESLSSSSSSSPKRNTSPTTVSESCAMRSNKGVKSIKEIRQRPERLLC
ncbi:terminal nucleotidyltransferase 4B-like isoform X3 [Xenia sp. Carnegie-2017]|uniref:terminal nucleotidyltransferase 4B-like isoform X3 n=1 Tax=Xenia sp. Carnegie-2017 TaxID=2897299 RepID=UPI001F03FB6C|nr:terminal nucleotidyltransferase 4B-like isoform X3 [Xenia sp. Carnegie-2017]